MPTHRDGGTLSPARWGRISAFLDEILDLPPDQRYDQLERACAGDSSLRADVETILRAGDEAGSCLEEGPGARTRTLLMELLEQDDRETDALIGQVVGHWRVVRRLGQGGMGAVGLHLQAL